MRHHMAVSAMLTFLCFSLGPAHAEQGSDNVLSAEALAHCASQVHTLRLESQRLQQLALRNDARRDALAEQRAALGDDDQAARARYNAEAEVFNERMARYRADLQAVNELKAHYAQHCAQRAYRRSDLEALPKAHQRAMRQGLADVQVPHGGSEAADGP